MQIIRWTLGRIIAMALTLAAVAGCSSSGSDMPTAHLQGTVMIDGQPIPDDAEARISFRGTAVGQASPTSVRLEGGRFDVLDAPQGAVRVTFMILQPTGMAAFQPGADVEMQKKSLVPEEHAGGILIDVEGDKVGMEFDL